MKTIESQKFIFCNIKRICILFILFLCNSCEEWDYIYMTNNGRDSVYVYPATGYYVDNCTAYPDTLLPDKDIIYRGHSAKDVFPLRNISPDKSAVIHFVVNEDMGDFLRETLPKDTLSVFIISCDTMNKYGYDVVAKENKILVRYDLSIPDLERMNYNIPYPPAPWMKDMKMYPSYDNVVNRYK